MLLRYFYNTKLAHASYLVGCQATGEAIVIDPGRDLAPYLREAQDQDMRIVAATETHIHADFLSGARELAECTGARLYLSGEGGEAGQYSYLASYNHRLLQDGDMFKIGHIHFTTMHTPGHTPEHIALIVTDAAHADEPMGVFTGDFVFVGDVGRPDLLEKAAGIADTAEESARQMFHSLQRFKELPDYLQLWPAHGAGSACGKNLGAVPSSTVGYERRFNWALNCADEATFVEALLAGQPEPPRYFATMKQLNQAGPPLLRNVPVPAQLPAEGMFERLEDGAIVVDTRPAEEFAAGHLPGTINLPVDGSFTTWAGWLLPYTAPVSVICAAHLRDTIIDALRSIGLDNLAGYSDLAVLAAWRNQGHKLQSYAIVPPQEVADAAVSGDRTLVDVRSASEWSEGYLPNAIHMMLGYVPEQAATLPADRPTVVYCQSGVRSAIGASLLQAQGIANVVNMSGGLVDWRAAGLPIAHDEPDV